MEDLDPRVEMTHVGVGQRDVRLDFFVDRHDDAARQQIVNDDGTVRPKRLYDSLGAGIDVKSLKLDIVNWCHVLPPLAASVFHAAGSLRAVRIRPSGTSIVGD